MNELDDLVTGAEIGRRLGLTRERVRQLAERDDFPPSLGRLGQSRVWRWHDIEQWNTQRWTRESVAGGKA